MTIFIIIALLAFFILAWKKLDWAILLIIAVLPSYLIRFQVMGLPFTLLEGFILIAFAVWLFIKDGLKVKSLFKKEERRSYPYRFEIMIMLMLAGLAIITAGLKPEAFGTFKAYFFEPILLFILILNNLRNETGRQKIIYALSASALIVSLFAIYQKISGQFITNPFWAAAESRRVVSFFGYPNAVGLFLAPIIPLAISQLFEKISLKNKLFFLLSALLSLLSILFAKSEGALIGLAVSGFICAMLVNKKIRLAVIGLGLVVMALILLINPWREIIISKITLSDLSGQIRQQQWVETKKMLAGGHFWLGAGLSNYQTTVVPYHQEGIFLKNNDPNWLEKIRSSEEFRKKMWQPTEIYMYPHNIFLNFWSELGLAGALLFSWIIAKFLWQSIGLYLKENKYLALGLSGAMLSILIHGLVDVPYFKNDLAVFFWILIALLGALLLETKTKK